MRANLSPARPGRPRDARLDEALMSAAMEVFLEQGYHAATFSEISRRAGVGTPAIYRRWPTKAALAIDLYEQSQSQDPLPDTGSIRADLIVFMRSRIRYWRTRVFHRLVLPLLMEGLAERSAEVGTADRYRDYRKPQLARIQRAIDSGELKHTDPNRVLNYLLGTVANAIRADEQAIDSSAKVCRTLLSTDVNTRLADGGVQAQSNAQLALPVVGDLLAAGIVSEGICAIDTLIYGCAGGAQPACAP